MSEYVERQNGVPLGAPGSLRNMISRSLGAASLAEFWRFWNPIWGYALGRFVYSPVRRLLPPVLAVIITFAVSGALHDIAATLVRRSPTFIVTPWFVFLGLGVILSQMMGMNMAVRPWSWRAAVNIAYLAACLGLALLVKQIWTGQMD
jgi:hypothetical protein